MTLSHQLLIGLTSILGTCGTYLAYTLEAVIVAYFFLRWRDNHYPDAVIITDLATLLRLVDTYPRHWELLDFRRQLSVLLEHIAICFESNIPTYLSAEDQGIRNWQRDNFLQVATSVRNLVMWVTTPKPDTREFFLNRVHDLLTNAAYGQWDLLERAQPTAMPAPKSLIMRTLGWCGVLIQAALIPLGVLIFHHLVPSLALPPYIYALAIGWPVVRLLAVWDPDVKSRIETIKEAMQLLPSSKGDKK